MQPIPQVREMSIQRALEWAFRDECAQMDMDELHTSSGGVRGGVDTIWVLMQRGVLGTKVDGGGSSTPAWDAEIIASTVASLPVSHGGRGMAVQIASLARAGAEPDWMRDAKPRCVPVEWRNTKHGAFARTEIIRTIETVHRGRRMKRHEVACPVTYRPTQAQIAACRRNYLDWWGALLWLQGEMNALGILSRIQLTNAMPPLSPWRNMLRE
ncbi:hypothetical protein ACHFJ0_04940 [Paracoccus sp. NGMCC 1.201697]|uniref:Uncharacterized protein n=1 Tax=Paracoccus broussonetiae subsp. drimophilus TaxID=3373869 RepID=A0ABW7LKY2_9RHOB